LLRKEEEGTEDVNKFTMRMLTCQTSNRTTAIWFRVAH